MFYSLNTALSGKIKIFFFSTQKNKNKLSFIPIIRPHHIKSIINRLQGQWQDDFISLFLWLFVRWLFSASFIKFLFCKLFPKCMITLFTWFESKNELNPFKMMGISLLLSILLNIFFHFTPHTLDVLCHGFRLRIYEIFLVVDP